MLEEDELHEPDCIWSEEVEYDTNPGELLDNTLVQQGKREEMARFKEMGVCSYVKQEEALNDPEGIVIDVRWVIVNKGTRQEPNVRCRLVGREFAEGQP